jgi:hypothetical protein
MAAESKPSTERQEETEEDPFAIENLTHQRFFTEVSLYKPIPFDRDSIYRVEWLLEKSATIDCFCIHCRQRSTFRIPESETESGSQNRRGLKTTSTPATAAIHTRGPATEALTISHRREVGTVCKI